MPGAGLGAEDARRIARSLPPGNSVLRGGRARKEVRLGKYGSMEGNR